VVVVGVGFTVGEIREFVHEYLLVPYGQKARWLVGRGVSGSQLRRWRNAVFSGDLDRGLVPRHASRMAGVVGERTAFEKGRAVERAVHEGEVALLTARIHELEETNGVLGKAIGLLHQMNVQEPDETQQPTSRFPS
jgi:hypothetical protein